MSMTHVHRLAGCAPTPLAHYLKALGVLRLVAEQKDRTARGWWQDEAFCLSTVLNRQELERFFLYAYRPTPMLSPWNAGSGFYKNWDAKKGLFRLSKAFNALQKIETSEADRFSLIRDVIAVCRSVIARFAKPLNPSAIATDELKLWLTVPPVGEQTTLGIHKKDDKVRFIAAIAKQLGSSKRTFFDSAVSLVTIDEGKSREETIAYPSIWGGTGGTDGKLDFTNNFLRRVVELFDEKHGAPTRNSAELLLGSLGGVPVSSGGLLDSDAEADDETAIGQFHPGNAGGSNMVAGFSAKSVFNAWDFVLMLEGTVMLSSSVTKRILGQGKLSAAAPFCVNSEAVGYGSATKADESARGEQWMPLWNRPAKAEEVGQFIAQGRNKIGKRDANNAVDFARSIAQLGTARGIAAFQRFGYIERNGQANLATPLGRWIVSSQPHQSLLTEVSGWISGLARASKDDLAPNAFRSVTQRCQEAELACTRDGGSPANWQALLLALADAELQTVRNPSFAGKKNLHPLPRLSAGWVHAIGEASAEFRLGLALAGQQGIEAHWLPLDGQKRAFVTRDDKLAFDHRVVCAGRDLVDDCLALLRRRIIEGHRGEHRQHDGLLPLHAAPGAEPHPADLTAFLAGEVEDAKILRFALALMPLSRGENFVPPVAPHAGIWNPLYCLFRLIFMPTALRFGDGEKHEIAPDAAILARLAAGNLADAAKLALTRLRAAGLRPTLRLAVGDPTLARRLAASLAFGITKETLPRLAYRILKPSADPDLRHDQPNAPEPTDDIARPLPA